MAILASLMADCETILAAADALQKASFTGLKTETVQSLDRIDQLSTARVQDLSRASRDAIDHMFWRALELALVVCAADELIGLASFTRSGASMDSRTTRPPYPPSRYHPRRRVWPHTDVTRRRDQPRSVSA